MTGWLERLLVALRESRVELSAEDIADVVWLAPHLDLPKPEPKVEEHPSIEEPEVVEPPSPQEIEQEPLKKPEPQPVPCLAETPRTGPKRSDLHLPGDGKGSKQGGRPLRAPTGSALPASLALSRALRSLRRRIPSRTRFVFDEAETVRRIAEEGIWLPALRPARERWLELSMVIDDGPSMGPWRSVATELLAMFASLGAFRSIRVWSLETDSTPVRLRAGLARQGSARRDPRELIDPANRSLIIVLTDGVADSWSDGQIAKILEDWSRVGPVGLLQVLPEHLWPRSALGLASAVRLTATAPASANCRLHSRSTDPFGESLVREGSPVPVASLTPEGLSSWSRLVAGAVGAEVPGFRLDLSPISLPPPTVAESPAPTPQETRERFWRVASPTARRLAGLLAVSPTITLPVLRLIRQALMPEARQVHEAEVLLGGLLRIVDKSDESARNPDEVRYEFREGLRPLLLDAVPSGDVLDVLAEVSSYVEENLAHGLDFRAMLADPAAAAGAIDRNEGPFARITAEVLLRLGGDYARLVANLPDGEPIEKGRRQKPTSEPPQRTMNDSTAQDSTGLPPLEDETSIEFSLTIDDAQQLSADEIVELSARSSGGNRVQLDYDVRVGEAIETSELPFVIGVLADLSGRADRPLPRAMIRESYAIHEGNFETIMRAIGLRLKLELTDICHDPEHLRRSHLFGDLENLEEVGFSLNSSGEYSITVVLLFGGMSDFEPIAILDQILDQVAKLKSFYMVKKNQLDLDLEQAKYHTYKSAEDHARAIFGIRIEIVRIIIRKILSHPEFRRLEATWRGLKALVQQVGRNPRITVRVGDVSKQNLARLLEASSKVDLNTLLGKAYEEQFGLSENVPCGLLLGDYEFDHSKSDLRLLSKLSRVAAKAHCPFVAAAAPLMFGFQSFGKLPKTLEDVQTYFNSIAPSDWRSFRESENSRFVALVLPRVLGRRPYNTGTDVDKDLPAEVLGRILYATGIYPVMDFPFQEIAGPEERLPLSHERYLWISAAWALGVCLADSISKHGWPASIRGANQGGLVEKLPLHFFVNDRGSALLAGPTEVAISDPLQFELASAGFITLVPAANPDDALFRSVPTCHKPKSSNQPDARTTAEFGAQLNMILCVSRFVHYLQVILREKVGSFASAGDCEAWLNSWITQYVGDANDDNDGVSAARPLSYARIDVEEPPGKTGWFRVILSIKPAYQLEELPFPIREFFEVRRSP